MHACYEEYNGSIDRYALEACSCIFIGPILIYPSIKLLVSMLYMVDLCTNTQTHRASGVPTFDTCDSLLVTSDTKSKAPPCQL